MRIEWPHFSTLVSLILTGGRSCSPPWEHLPFWLHLELELYEGDPCFQTVSPARVERWLQAQQGLVCPSGLAGSEGQALHDTANGSRAEPRTIDWATLSLVYHGEPSDYCVISPRPAPGVVDRLLEWLLEPMPETWLVAALEGSPGRGTDEPWPLEGRTYRIEELDRPRLGRFPLCDPEGQRRMGYAVWKVCDAGTSRFELMRRVQRLQADPLNPLTGTGLRIRNQRILLYVLFRRAGLDRYPAAPETQRFETVFYVPHHYAALPDALALLATLARYTRLTAPEMLALLVLVYLPAIRMHEVAYSKVRSNSSMVLQTFLWSWMEAQESALVQALLAKTLRDQQADRLELVPTFQLEGVTFRHTNLYGRGISNRLLFQSWMMVRSPLALPTASWDDLTGEQFVDLLRTHRSMA